jgi:hypothetical protein
VEKESATRQNGLRRLKGVALLLMVALGLLWITRPDNGHQRHQRPDPELRALRMFLRYPWMPPDAKERAEEAMAKYRNKTLDPEPVLIGATLGKPTGIDQVYLNLLVYDECEDLEGFVVKEECYDPNGAQFEFEERYPAFAHLLMTGVADIVSIPVHIRDVHERKDEERWAKYCDQPLPAHTEESMSGEKLPRGSSMSDTRWEATLPPVWISIPEPNRVIISLYLYDCAGYRSNRVTLLNLLSNTGN